MYVLSSVKEIEAKYFNENKKLCKGSFDKDSSDVYFHKILMDSLANGVLTALHETATNDVMATNSVSFSALSIIKNALLQKKNVGLRKTLQSVIEPPYAQKMKDIRRVFFTSTHRQKNHRLV